MGRYFRTTEDAPINSEEFDNGFTVESIFKLPRNFNRSLHSWMGILTRQGHAADRKIKQKAKKKFLLPYLYQVIKKFNGQAIHPI